MQIGQKVIWIVSNRIATGEITKVDRGCVWVNHHHKAEDAIYLAYAFPDEPACRAMLNETLEMRARHVQENEQMLERHIAMNNHLIRDGLK